MIRSRRTISGGRIKRTRPVTFSFNGVRYSGFDGDTLASALLANGVRTVHRSFKFHRRRGLFGSGSEEPNAIVEIGTGEKMIPNLRATQVEIYEGLIAQTNSGWPSLNFDLLSIFDYFGKILPAGFYYKTFMWPRFLWNWYEKNIRKMSGLGRAPSIRDKDKYEKLNAHCEVLIVGSGPAGLMAARAAGRTGARVILADEQAEFGGSLLYRNDVIGTMHSTEWVKEVLKELRAMPEVKLLLRSTVTGYYDHNFLVINERCTDHLEQSTEKLPRERLWRVRAKQVVLATGAIERPLVFSNNDRPGVMLASAVSTYLIRYGVCAGRKTLIFTNNDSAYRTALDLHGVGAEVAAIVDVRTKLRSDLVSAVKALDIPIFEGHGVIDVRSGPGGIRSAMIARLSDSLDDVLMHKGEIRCDTIAVSGGWNPAVHLHAQSGGKPQFSNHCASVIPGISIQKETSAGGSNGTFGLLSCLREGAEAGQSAAENAGFKTELQLDIPAVKFSKEQLVRPIWVVPNGLKEGRGGKKFIDYQNDTTVADIILAVREGYRSVEHLKRYTALGFGTDQGKLGNINGMAILAQITGKEPGQIGTTTFRPNYTPVTFGAIGGRKIGPTFFDLTRKTAIHQRHEELGALFENVGQWKRPWYYPKEGETIQQTVNRECRATRTGVGVLDGSTLGKIYLRGPDALTLLNRIYTNSWDNLAVGRCRYGLMLGEDGMVMDDGVTSRLSHDEYFMNTTTGNAAQVLSWMERWLQTEWPGLKVYLTSATDHWAVISLSGPNSREVLSNLCNDIDFSDEAFPFMSFQEGTVAGLSARVFRVSFSGERCYEINVSAKYGCALWDAVMETGERFDITPYGTEAMHVLRAEKGYIIVGQDTDGSVTPHDLGMSWIVSKKKDFIGKRSLYRREMVKEHRKQLVGLSTIDPEFVLPEGAQLISEPSTQIPVGMIGHVTSSYFSTTLKRSIALALVKGGAQLLGTTIFAHLIGGQVIPVEIRSPIFFDPKNERQIAGIGPNLR